VISLIQHTSASQSLTILHSGFSGILRMPFW